MRAMLWRSISFCIVISGISNFLTSAQDDPTVFPTRSPTFVPTFNSFIDKVRSSKTYKVRNLYAWVGLLFDKIVVLGNPTLGGGSTQLAESGFATEDVTEVVDGYGAYAARRASTGGIFAWGTPSAIRGMEQLVGVPVEPGSLVGNEDAFAAIETGTGRVVAMGNVENGGDVSSLNTPYAVALSQDIVNITASAASFAGLTSNRTVYTWGNTFTGGGVSSSDTASTLQNVELIVSTRGAFACLLEGGQVVTFGDKISGGDSSAVAQNLTQRIAHIVGAKSVFAAFTYDLGLVTWGVAERGGDSSAVAHLLQRDVMYVTYTDFAFAALKTDGSVVTWGDSLFGGDSAAVQDQLVDVTHIYSNGRAFVALTEGGSLVAWGEADSGGVIPPDLVSTFEDLRNNHGVGIKEVLATRRRAFLARMEDDTAYVWGHPAQGGDAGPVVNPLLRNASSPILAVCGNEVAFAALNTQGQLFLWGHETALGQTGGFIFPASSANFVHTRVLC
mmetsp:Transcript_22079/g.37263  ORF Transcript_22079/g.37263 Transcript_22079/m.37263 type:complete len:502 (+) Transcript_22079:49-1554(+)